MYRVAIKDSATGANSAVRDLVTGSGSASGSSSIRTFESREAAERFAADMCDRGSPVRLQAVAELDPAEVDAYLVKDAQCNEWEPIAREDDGTVTFPVGGNIYGQLGLALVYLRGTVSPALSDYVSRELGRDSPAAIRDVQVEPPLHREDEPAVSWQPDLRIEVSQGRSEPAETYYAEVKSGQASFGRSQRSDMQRVAGHYGVLRIRVDLSDLPRTYRVRIDEVHPAEWPG